jgi:hypothetical protein
MKTAKDGVKNYFVKHDSIDAYNDHISRLLKRKALFVADGKKMTIEYYFYTRQHSFKKGDKVRVSGEHQTGIVVSHVKKEQQGPVKYAGGPVKIKYDKSNGKKQGVYLEQAMDVKLV